MALALVRCSIEADQGGTPHARARVSLVSWEGRSHALLFMVPLGLPSARPMAQALRLPFEYYIYIFISIQCYAEIYNVIQIITKLIRKYTILYRNKQNDIQVYDTTQKYTMLYCSIQ